MDEQRITDRATIADKRSTATDYELRAQRLRREADEIERLMELARCTPAKCVFQYDRSGHFLGIRNTAKQPPRYGAPNDPSIRR